MPTQPELLELLLELPPLPPLPELPELLLELPPPPSLVAAELWSSQAPQAIRTIRLTEIFLRAAACHTAQPRFGQDDGGFKRSTAWHDVVKGPTKSFGHGQPELPPGQGWLRLIAALAGTSMGLARKILESRQATRTFDVLRRVAGGVIMLVDGYFLARGLQ